MNRDQLVTYLDQYLRISEIKDSSNNGLQVEGAEDVDKVAFAVDACMEAFKRAGDAGAQMLLTHHGLFWGEVKMLRGVHRQRVSYLLQHNISLYSAHLPLDIHPEVGHNVQLARLLGLKVTGTFGDYNGQLIGVLAEPWNEVNLDQVVQSLEDQLGSQMTVLNYGPQQIKRVGIISGGAAPMVDQAAEKNLDLFLTGEASHTAFHQVAERELNVVYGGHYATETLGLKALAKHLEERFDLKTEFLDIPTGF